MTNIGTMSVGDKIKINDVLYVPERREQLCGRQNLKLSQIKNMIPTLLKWFLF